MKLYNCPDCTYTEDTCENCSRYILHHKINLTDINIFCPHYKTLTFANIPSACQKCPNHPSNGGAGNCNCTIGEYDFTCSYNNSTLGGTSNV